VLKKINKSYKKLCPEAKEIINDKYKAAIKILESN
jgi:hypothetical protein